MNKVYEKPKMKIVSLQNNEKIADTCWGNHSEDTQRYFDTVGTGYVGFYIAGGNCNLWDEQNNVYYLVVNYYDHKGDTTAEKLPTDDPRYQLMFERLMKEGGNHGQPFHGESNYPDKPDGMS